MLKNIKICTIVSKRILVKIFAWARINKGTFGAFISNTF